MPIKLNGLEGASLLNIQYGVCFGSIFALLFRANSRSEDNLDFVISLDNPTTFLILVAYFFLDWAFSNFLRERIDFSLWRLVLFSISIWCLGATVIMSNTSNDQKYLFLGAYTLAVSFYHLSNYGLSFLDIVYHIPVGSAIVGFIISAVMLLLGIIIMWNSVLFSFGKLEMDASITRLSIFVAAVFLLLKIFHVVNLYTNLPAREGRNE